MPIEMETELETLQSCDLCGSDRLNTIDAETCLCACQRCGYVFDNPRPTAQAIAAYYSKPAKYDGWLRDEKPRDALWKRRLRKMETTRKPGSLLDIGTGIGQFLYHARPFYTHVYGTEVSDSAIEIARQKYNLAITKGDIESGVFAENTFDNITLFHVLEHVPSPRSLIDRCRALLVPGGILVIAVPNDVLGIRYKVKVALKKLGVKRFSDVGKLGLRRITLDGTLDEIHVSHFTPDVLEGLVKESGFSAVENTLDPYYAATGFRKVVEDLHYGLFSLWKVLLGTNLYDTIWVVGRKNQRRGAS